MDAINIYKEWYQKKYNLIKNVLLYYKQKNCGLALWGAGKKGIAFLEVFDSENGIIDYVYDRDMARMGEILPTGHQLVCYDEKRAEIVLVANSSFELDVIHILRNAGMSPKIINIDNIMLGNMPMEEIINGVKPNLRKVRQCKICAVTVLYNPDRQVVENIASYAASLERVYLFDNSEQDCTETIIMLKKLPNIEYIKKPENIGLPLVFNEAGQLAEKADFDWMITFDQDSIAMENMIYALREYVCSAACGNRTAIVAPVVNQIDNKDYVQQSYCSYFDRIIQSGAMHNLHIMKKLGGYDEKLFIDNVDYEYSIRCVVEGFEVIKINSAVLRHNQQDDKVEKRFLNGSVAYLNKYSPTRYYYQYRNALYCYDKYKEKYPLFALDCLNSMRKMELNVKYDVDSERKCGAIERAKEDYQNGKMGKFRGRFK